MFVGTLQIEMLFPGCQSLKEKRYVVQSLKQRIRNKFNVSVGEIDYLDKWQRGVLGIACVSNQYSHANEMLQKVLLFAEQETRIEITDSLIEIT